MTLLNQRSQGLLDIFQGLWRAAGMAVRGDFQGFMKGIEQYNKGILESILSTVGLKLADVQRKFDEWGAGLKSFLVRLAADIRAIIDGMLQNLSNINLSNLNLPVPSFDAGGYVPQTGLALLHRGEYVIPAPAVTNVNVTAPAGAGRTFNYNHYGDIYGVSDLQFEIGRALDNYDRGLT